MKFINLNNIEIALLDFAMAKDDLENIWLSEGLIETPLNIRDFIACLDISKNSMFVKRTQSYVPFKYMVGNKDSYIFYFGELNEKDKKYLEEHKNIADLHLVNPMDLVKNNLSVPNSEYFFIDGTNIYK